MVSAKEITSKMGVEPSFPIKRHALRKKHFDENNSEKVILQAIGYQYIRVPNEWGNMAPCTSAKAPS
jgi:hypothetical protein